MMRSRHERGAVDVRREQPNPRAGRGGAVHDRGGHRAAAIQRLHIVGLGVDPDREPRCVLLLELADHQLAVPRRQSPVHVPHRVARPVLADRQILPALAATWLGVRRRLARRRRLDERQRSERLGPRQHQRGRGPPGGGARRSATPNGAAERSCAHPVCASPRRGAPRIVVTVTRSPGRTVPTQTVAPPRCSSAATTPQRTARPRLRTTRSTGVSSPCRVSAGARTSTSSPAIARAASADPRRRARRAAAPPARTATPPGRSCRSGTGPRLRAASPTARLRTRTAQPLRATCSGTGTVAEQVLDRRARGLEPAVGHHEPVPERGDRERLHVVGQRVVAPLGDRAGLCAAHERDRGPRRRAKRDARAPSGSPSPGRPRSARPRRPRTRRGPRAAPRRRPRGSAPARGRASGCRSSCRRTTSRRSPRRVGVARRGPTARTGRAGPRAADRCRVARSGSRSRSRRRARASGWVMPSTVTWRSSIGSSNAACVRGGVRLISSTSTTLAKTGPGMNRNEPSRWS